MLTERPKVSPYLEFRREEWSRLRHNTPLLLSEEDLERLRGLNERVSLDEVADIYLPVSRLLNLYVEATQKLHDATQTFLGSSVKVPFVLGIAGSVAVGKSTAARILRELLARWPSHPRVDLVATDGFLYPNRILTERGIMHRKGFPESYDRRAMVRFLADLKSGAPVVEVPVYSHLFYDIVPGKLQVIERPDIVIVEGLNVLQTGAPRDGKLPRVFVSDYFDFSIYVDARAEHIRRWYVERFLTLRATAFRDPASYFHRYADLSVPAATETARAIWDEINGVNLTENIQPTRNRADLVLRKGEDHAVTRVMLRKL
ncbi:MAG TPA: type I pantothenate kinase [Actinomycetota bacterium]|nr:type I pantothenate kinase [Actinomycetota bacterium]